MIQCPDCSGNGHLVGQIPATDFFAGRILREPLSGGALYRCTRCSLGFRWPRLSKDRLDDLYAQGGALTWTAQTDSRRDWRIARQWITQRLPRRSKILDIGCFDGGFLEPLVEHHDCHGIEIHPEAAERARAKGVVVVGSDFSALSGSFDCITAFDVIEHVERPHAFLKDCLSALKQGGLLLISTGNQDALVFRLMGSRYRYYTIAEHISFVSPKWFSRWSESLGYEIEVRTSFSHGGGAFRQSLKEAAINLLYRFFPGGFRLLRRSGFGGKDTVVHPELADHPPVWSNVRDHFMVLARKR